MKKIITKATHKLKAKVDMSRKDLQFAVGDYVMVHLNKSRLQKGTSTKLQMKRVGPCQVLEKYGKNAYKVELPVDLGISLVFNVADLIRYKGPVTDLDQKSVDVLKDMSNIALPPKDKLQAERILESRVKKSTRHKEYMEHLIKWKEKPESEATWVDEAHFKK